MVKKINIKKITAAVIALTSCVAGITVMTTTQSVMAQTEDNSETSSYSAPAAGLSTQTLLSGIGSDDVYVNFVSVSSVAQTNIAEQNEAVETIEQAVAEIEVYVETAKGYADEYSQAQEAYEEAVCVLKEANVSLEAAMDAEIYVIADMYAEDMQALIEEAASASEDAKEAYEAAKEAEEEAAAEAAEKAAAEAAAKAAAEKAAAEAAAEAEAAAAEEEADEESSSEGSSDSSESSSESSDADAIRQSLVSYAKSFAGVLAYKSGGTSLKSGVDCSGFTQAIYAAYGYSLPRTSSAQASCGRSVSLSEIKVGDLVCYSGHVGIYIGNGQIVHAPGSGRTVCVASMYIMSIKSVRRIIE